MVHWDVQKQFSHEEHGTDAETGPTSGLAEAGMVRPSLDVVESGDVHLHKTWPPKFHTRDIVFGLWALFTFAFDYGTDLRLAVEYVENKEYTWFILTLSFIAVPSFISGIISVIWYKMTYKRDVKYGYRHAKTLYYSRMIFSFLQLGRIFRQLEYLYCIVHTFRMERVIKKLEVESDRKNDEEIEKLKKEVNRMRLTATAEKRDAAILGLIDGFMESALQLLLQLYLTVQYSLPLTFPRAASLLSSLFSTAMIQTTYYRANRKANIKKYNADYFSTLLYFLWRFVELGPRYLVLVLATFYLHPWCYILIPIHIIYVITLYAMEKPELEGICSQPLDDSNVTSGEQADSLESGNLLNPELKGDGHDRGLQEGRIAEKAPAISCTFPSVMSKVFIFLMGIIGLLSFINLKEHKEGHGTFKTTMLFYVVYYIENFAVVILIIFQSLSMGVTDWVYCLFAVPVGLLCHVIFVFLFYSFFHPKNTMCPPIKLHCCCLNSKKRKQSLPINTGT